MRKFKTNRFQNLAQLAVPLWLTYDNQKIQDGFGAQLLRIITLKAICNYYHIGYKHSPIGELKPNHLDPFQTLMARAKFLKRVQNTFFFEESSQKSFDNVKHVYNFSRRILIKEALLALLSRKKTLLKVAIPYYVSRGNPKMFREIVSRDFFSNSQNKDQFKTVVVHFRQGVDPLHIDSGKHVSRMVPFSYFESQLRKIVEIHGSDNLKIYILTDSPKQPYTYYPPGDAIKAWKVQNYKLDKSGGVRVKSYDFTQTLLKELPNVKVFNGGDPLKALNLMSKADYLIMSDSALSYLGGTLNKNGVCIVPKDYKPGQLKNWIKGDDFLIRN